MKSNRGINMSVYRRRIEMIFFVNNYCQLALDIDEST